MQLIWIHHQAVMIYLIELSAILHINISAEDERNMLFPLDTALFHFFKMLLNTFCIKTGSIL